MKNDRNIIKATFSIDKHMLELAETIFKELGLTLDLGIAVYLYQVVYTSSIPFSIKLPPQEMIERVDLYKKLMKGRDDIKAGRVVSSDIMFEEIRRKLGLPTMNIEMKLADEPLELMVSGMKTVEIRLYDEKRKKITVGDTIEFIRLNGDERVSAKVVALHRFDSFRELFASDLRSKTGFGDLSEADAVEAMYKYYTKEQESKYGVLGIEIVLI